jgi:hypothetical protein
LTLTLAGCVPHNVSTHSNPRGSRDLTFVFARDAAGQRILYPSRNGVVDRLHPISTDPSDWGNPASHQEPIVCESTHFVEHITQQEICVMFCSDGSHYKIPCNADIFADGFDHEVRE